jgi:hypothetical protein
VDPNRADFLCACKTRARLPRAGWFTQGR